MLHHNNHWLDFVSFIGLILVVGLAFTVLVWPQTTAQAADSFAHMLRGLQLVLLGQ
ncbi:MAG: hypothetical protein RSD57_16500 [Comamonas sp.]|jgi:hypothetical protein